MADADNKNEGTVVPGEVTPLMQEAIDQGWVPKDDFEGDPERFVDYAEFVRRGELFRKIEQTGRDNKELRKALNELAKHNAKIREVEYQRALADFKSQKKNALAEGDFDKVEEIEEKIDLVKDQQRSHQQEVIQSAVPQEIHPEFAQWVSKNSWYESTISMQKWADGRGQELAQEGKSPREVLQTLEREVKGRFPEKFSNPNRSRPGAVEAPRAAQRAGKADNDYELSDTERSVMETLVKQKVLTKEEYVAQLRAIKEKS
jgi:hypothetical protein